MSTLPPPPRQGVPPSPKKGVSYLGLLLAFIGVPMLVFVPAVLQDRSRAHRPVEDRSVRPGDLRKALPALMPADAETIVRLEISDVRCTPLSPATATQVLRVPRGEEQVELALRRQMAELRWRDVPRRSHVDATSVTMRYERGIGEGQVGTLSYVLSGDGQSTTVRLALVGSITGRCGVR